MYKVNLLKANFRLGSIIGFIFIFIYISFIFTELNIICKCKNILNWLVNIFNISCIWLFIIHVIVWWYSCITFILLWLYHPVLGSIFVQEIPLFHDYILHHWKREFWECQSSFFLIHFRLTILGIPLSIMRHQVWYNRRIKVSSSLKPVIHVSQRRNFSLKLAFPFFLFSLVRRTLPLFSHFSLFHLHSYSNIIFFSRDVNFGSTSSYVPVSIIFLGFRTVGILDKNKKYYRWKVKFAKKYYNFYTDRKQKEKCIF